MFEIVFVGVLLVWKGAVVMEAYELEEQKGHRAIKCKVFEASGLNFAIPFNLS